ncbi:MAG: circadian clock protein KaiC [Chloroflexi bacterium]|nr:circadian clock protein KaiC [Chloroflexota bacterium]
MSLRNAPQPANAVDKMPTGIEGFDAITFGGLPRRRVTLVVGESGSGKTVFALQTLVNGASQWDEPGIFVAFEEQSQQLIENAATFGWDLLALEREKLFFLNARLSPDMIQTGDFDLIGMLATLQAKVAELGARRIVFDSLDVLLNLLNDPVAERQEVYRVLDWLQTSGLSGIITSRILHERIFPYEFLQFASDCVVQLHQRVYEQVAIREVRVLKYRGSAFAPNEFPMDIGQTGIDIVGISPSSPEPVALLERVSSGVARLDTMLNGGYYRGNSVLITGAPGTSKSTLSGAFSEAACQRGERALYVGFDEGGSEIVRNLRSVGVNLQPHIDAGLLRLYSGDTIATNSVKHLIAVRDLLYEFKPACLVIDPLSAFVKTGEPFMAERMGLWLLRLAKSEGITVVCTSLLEGSDAEAEGTSIRVSTIADTWIHLSYVVRGGERNRALTIVKSRGTGHTNQVRELILSDDGITLTDVYAVGR